MRTRLSGDNMKSKILTLAFLVTTALPQVVKAEATTDLKQCLQDIRAYWINQSPVHLKGHTRNETPCEINLNLSSSSLDVQAAGNPLQISFSLQESTTEETRTLQSCRVDKEKLHIVFDEKTTGDFTKRERVQMTLLKRHGKGLSLILNKRENKMLRPLLQTSLICHLN